LASQKSKEAELLLRIYEIYSSESMVNAFTWFFKEFRAENVEDFEERYPLGSQGRKYFWRIGNFFDLLGTFVKRNYLPTELVVEFCPDDLRSFWKAARNIVIQMRKKWDDPTLYENLELLNDKIEKWHNKSKRN